jgi:Zn-dependent protease with chaperone function
VKEAIFPLLGPVLVFALALPASALLARLLLRGLSRLERTDGVHAKHGIRYAILVLSSSVPLAWFISASLHQVETGANVLVCSLEHAPEAFCPEAAYFSLALLVLAASVALPRLAREQFLLRPSASPRAARLRSRVLQLAAKREGLRGLVQRLVVTDEARTPIATVGVLHPRVVVQASFAERLDDESLAGALHHELVHLRARDPLRYFLLWWALAVNPLGRFLLKADHARWLLGREAHCDRAAVIAGASPIALAQALVVAARPPARGLTLSAALGDVHVDAMKLRVDLLFAYADRMPVGCCRQPALRLVAAFLVLVLVLPHQGGTQALDIVHQASETAVALLIAD